ncbi:hypothetical protein RDI58_004609 [Solanum bulbocastanum]|uniref:Uncharacterized protein n=1 Tax=Solanum bulbocastanum TaxID=147425 RepID=A0AAN8TXX4_SOLBU
MGGSQIELLMISSTPSLCQLLVRIPTTISLGSGS